MVVHAYVTNTIRVVSTRRRVVRTRPDPSVDRDVDCIVHAHSALSYWPVELVDVYTYIRAGRGNSTAR